MKTEPQMLRDEDSGNKRVCIYLIAPDDAYEHHQEFVQKQVNVIQLINDTAGWQYEDMYMDRRGEQSAFNEMLEDCIQGKIDVIVTKSIWQFAGSIRETLATALMLLAHDPPVEIVFSDQAVFSSDRDKIDPMLEKYGVVRTE